MCSSRKAQVFISILGALVVITINGQQKCAGRVCIPESYDSLEAPRENNMKTKVYLDLHEWTPVVLTHVDDKMSTLTLDLLFNIKWHDPRITCKGLSHVSPFRVVPDEISRRLWRPELAMTSMKSAKVKRFQGEDLGGFILIYENHSIIEGNLSVNFWHEMTLDLWCDMDFYSFPYDKHVSRTCKFL